MNSTGIPPSGPKDGMDLRDWFAGQALMGMCMRDGIGASAARKGFAEWSYDIADAMIAARNGETK